MESFLKVSYVNSTPKRMLVKYILGNINKNLQSTSEHDINYYDVNIEHVMPQKPEDDWNISQNDLKQHVNLLGNLTLLDKRINSKAQNHTIDKKLPLLSKSELDITKNLVKYICDCDDVWTFDQIIERHTYFGELAYSEIWSI